MGIINFLILLNIFIIIIIIINKKKENSKKENSKNEKKPTIYILCKSWEYKFFEDYIKSLEYKFKKLKINYEVILKNSIDDSFFLNKSTKSNFVFLHNLKYVKISEKTENKIIPFSYIVNTEQLTRRSELTDMLNYINKGYKLIDYSIGNITILNTYNFPKSTFFYIPYQVNYDEIDLENNERPLTICSITPESSKHRKYVYYTIKSFNIADITQIKGFNKERDNMILNHKILLNIHFDPSYLIFESIRCDRLIFNKVIIFSEKSLSSSIPIELEPYIIEFHSLNEAYTILENIMQNPSDYYNKFWEGFNLKKIDFVREMYFKQWLDTIIKQRNVYV